MSKGCAYKENKDNKGECIIFKMPNDDISFNDGIKGRLKKPIGDIDDFVLVRSNGKPVFHLANVVDDIEQKNISEFESKIINKCKFYNPII